MNGWKICLMKTRFWSLHGYLLLIHQHSDKKLSGGCARRKVAKKGQKMSGNARNVESWKNRILFLASWVKLSPWEPRKAPERWRASVILNYCRCVDGYSGFLYIKLN